MSILWTPKHLAREEEERRKRAEKTKTIELATRRIVNDNLAGQYHSVFKGRGIEFDQVRPYSPGDDVRAIDWNVTARALQPFVRQYHEERELTLLLAVDCSFSGYFGTRVQTKREQIAELSALFAFSAIRNHDKVGLLLFTDHVEKVILPRKGRKHVLRVIDEILSYEPRGRKTDLKETLAYVSRLKLRRSIVVLLSDFLDRGFEDDLRTVARKHDLIGVWVSDPAEESLPELGLLKAFDPESGETYWIDTLDPEVRRSYKKHRTSFEESLVQTFRKNRLDLLRIRSGEDYVPKINAFFSRRVRLT